MNHELPSDKPGLRAWAKTRRSTLDLPVLTPQILARLQAESVWAGARNVLLYLAMPGEINVEPLLQADQKRAFFVPRCAPNHRLAIHPFVPYETPLVPGPFGIREPDKSRVPEADSALLDLVVVPALLLSETGDRLGYGGGYYDRFLPTLAPNCVRVGLLPSALVVPCLPRNAWDVPLHRVITETKTFSASTVSL